MTSPIEENISLRSPHVIAAALQAIHWMVLTARREALDWTHGRKPVDAQCMVDMLDAIEGLQDIVKHDVNYELFRTLLAAAGSDFPQFSGLLRDFDRSVDEFEPDITPIDAPTTNMPWNNCDAGSVTR